VGAGPETLSRRFDYGQTLDFDGSLSDFMEACFGFLWRILLTPNPFIILIPECNKSEPNTGGPETLSRRFDSIIAKHKYQLS
jgi:hypothetical protein